jgi:tetrahydromethanopterin S-methyltransferase subunit C
MDEIRKRFDQLEHKGISVKACLAEMIGTGTFVLIGLMVAAYVGNFQPEKGMIVTTI